jgi:hypothetical protein
MVENSVHTVRFSDRICKDERKTDFQGQLSGLCLLKNESRDGINFMSQVVCQHKNIHRRMTDPIIDIAESSVIRIRAAVQI